MSTDFPGRLGFQQRVLPSYRAQFFDALAAACKGGMSLFAGQPRETESIATVNRLSTAQLVQTRNVHILGGSLYLCHQPGMREWLDDWQPDVLIVEANPRYISTPAGVRWMRRRGRPVIGWGLGSHPPAGVLSGLRQQIRMIFLQQFDALVAYSKRGADQYAAMGFPAERIFVAPNAVAPRPVGPAPERPESVDRPTVIYVGRLQARKRIDHLLKACARLPERLQPNLRIVGDGPARTELEVLAAQIYKSAEFTGAVHGHALAAHFSAADLFVLPGTGGLAVQEAMSYGLPVIVAKGDGTQDDLVRPENGWQIPTDDFDALFNTLQEALADIPRLRSMGMESYRLVSEEINLEKMVAVFVSVLNRVVG